MNKQKFILNRCLIASLVLKCYSILGFQIEKNNQLVPD